MNQISKKTVLKLLSYIVVFAAIVVFLLNPKLTQIEKNKKIISEKQKQLAENYDELASLQKIERDKEGFESIKNTVLGYLPSTLSSSQFIVEVEGLAKKTDITIDSVSMNAVSTSVSATKEANKKSDDAEKTESTKKKASGGTQQNQFTLVTKAEFSKAMSFIQQMEKLSRFNSISSISIVSTGANDTSIAITGNIYYEQ